MQLQAKLAVVSTDAHTSEASAAESIAELRQQLASYEEKLGEAAGRSQKLQAQLQAAEVAREAAEQVGVCVKTVKPAHTREGSEVRPIACFESNCIWARLSFQHLLIPTAQDVCIVAVDRDETVIRCCAQEAELKAVQEASEKAAAAFAQLQSMNGE